MKVLTSNRQRWRRWWWWQGNAEVRRHPVWDFVRRQHTEEEKRGGSTHKKRKEKRKKRRDTGVPPSLSLSFGILPFSLQMRILHTTSLFPFFSFSFSPSFFFLRLSKAAVTKKRIENGWRRMPTLAIANLPQNRTFYYSKVRLLGKRKFVK